MKTWFFVVLLSLLLPVTNKLSAQSFYFVTDSVRLYSYDQPSGQWIFSGVTEYNYSYDMLESTLSTDGNHLPVSQTTYTYNNGFVTEILTKVFKDGAWSDSQQQFLYYDSNDMLRERVVARWNTNQWQNLNRFTYIYDVDRKLIVYNREMWKNNQWTDFSADSLFYNTDNLLVLRSARLKSSGLYVTRQYYNYNLYGQRIIQLRQDYIDGQWVNINRINYLYNACGTGTGTLTENWINGAWVNTSRADEFEHYVITGRRIPVCFNGNTIYIKSNALESYLQRGACLGQCQSLSKAAIAGTQNTADKSLAAPFIVYPNPAYDRVAIRLTDPGVTVTSVELLDYYGRPLRSVKPGEETEIIIDLGNIKSGNYILRVTADSVYSIVISRN